MSNLDIEQGSEAWKELRLGRVTASRAADVIAKTKTGWGASRANYMAQLVAERLTGTAAEGFSNAAMQWGTDTEPQARLAYEFRTDATVEQIAFAPHPTIEMSGASPDGIIGDDGLVEIKCPNTATHIETLRSGKIAEKYVTQMMWQMASTGRAWCDFVSFDPRMPESMSLWIHRIERDEEMIAYLEKHIIEFLAELDGIVAELSRLYGAPTFELPLDERGYSADDYLSQ